MTRTNQETNYKKTTANDGGRTSPTSCRQEYLLTVVTEQMWNLKDQEPTTKTTANDGG